MNIIGRCLTALMVALLAGCATGESAEELSGNQTADAGDASDAIIPDTGTDVSQDVTLDVGGDVIPDAETESAADALEEAAPDVVDAGCPAGEKECGGTCVEIEDPAYGCGTTGCDSCELDNASATCDGGDCAIEVCEAGFADCDNLPGNGCEVDMLADPDNCGMCGHDCAVPNGTPGCENGSCTIVSCDTGFADCDPSIVNGCEANTQLDPSHCGGCGTLCQPVGSAACVNGACQTTGCDPGQGDCDQDPDNGCEVDLTSTAAHCGFCGNACSLTEAVADCVDSKCVVVSCNLGHGNCDGVDANGCEIDLGSTVAHCGGCDAPCSTVNNTSRACDAGLCSYVCNPGFADCNGLQSGAVDDGCETVTSADVNNCGACGVTCLAQNGSNACFNGVCSPQCIAGFGNCDGNPVNGCETSTSDNDAHCGSCGTACEQNHATNTCVAGQCVPSCHLGYADCDGDPTNGCETATSTDALNCGGCDVQCQSQNGSTSCVSGTCTPICSAGFGDCDGNPINGCETEIAVSPLHCGSCNNSCAVEHTQTSCVNGECAVVSCDPYYFDNDKDAANGCEYQCAFESPTPEVCDDADNDCDGTVDEDFDKQNDPSNCGSCENTCGTSSGGLCCGGVCRTSDPDNCGACGRSCTSGMLVINEVLANPAAVDDGQGEWFEIYNPNIFDVDIRGFTIRDDGSDSQIITSELPVIVPAGSYLVLGNNANLSTNGGAPVSYQYGTFFLGNSTDELEIVAYGVVLDRITWTSAFAPAGMSQELSINHRNATDNDSMTWWCDAVSVFGSGDLGTPGEANDCTLP